MGTRHHGAPIPIIFKIGESRRIGVPRCEELNEQADGRRRQYTIGPDYLGARAGHPVALRLLLETLICDEPTATHARMARHRKDHLPGDEESLLPAVMYVHSDIHVWNQAAPGESLQLLALGIGVDGTKNDVARSEVFQA